MSARNRLRLMVTGTSGQVGWELLRSLAPLGDVVAADRSRMDLSDPDAIRRTIRDIRPDVLVNPAAWTAVDRAEAEPDAAAAINAVAPGIMAEECRRLDALLVHYSTDFVFDGSRTEPWTEDDETAPLNVYGATKLAGERAVVQVGARHLVLRTSWVYSLRGNNFLRTMVRLAQRGGDLRVVDDQFGAPTPAVTLADLTAHMIDRHQASERYRPLRGVYHASCVGRTSWHGFAVTLLEKLFTRPAQRESLRFGSLPKIEPIPTSAYPLPARRPANSQLSVDKLEADWGLTMPDWQSALEIVLRDA
ncbi:MAG: dTDP-4-dehydrorhamnose reductase [Burkholderiaceae bacterium]|nr:dTDP-4-dehydrorhamnose reductase [Burkholderiaceae bacterium]